jgi:hypothetical protein
MPHRAGQEGILVTDNNDTDFVDIYANNCSAVSGLFEIALEFSTTSPVNVGPDGRPGAMEKKRVVLVRTSPQHAKAVAVLLLEHVLSYEKQYGSLPATPDMRAKWVALVKQLSS